MTKVVNDCQQNNFFFARGILFCLAFPYIFVMPNDNKSQKNNDKFYELFKELLETQNTIIKGIAEIKAMIPQAQKPRPSDADLWGGI